MHACGDAGAHLRPHRLETAGAILLWFAAACHDMAADTCDDLRPEASQTGGARLRDGRIIWVARAATATTSTASSRSVLYSWKLAEFAARSRVSTPPEILVRVESRARAIETPLERRPVAETRSFLRHGIVRGEKHQARGERQTDRPAGKQGRSRRVIRPAFRSR